jgi:hypothetical protein
MEPPDNPMDVTKNAIQECKDEIMYYDGQCVKGEEGKNPGRWYK